LIVRINQQQEEVEALEAVLSSLSDQLGRDEYLLGEVESVLGCAPQLRLEEANLQLRGQRLEKIAIEVLEEERGSDAEVHYREWFELLRDRGYRIAGKQPVNTFLAQIGRSPAVERVGRRTGRYRLAKAA
jgi:hypothetical protein